MHILETLAPVDAPQGSAVALGFFDGVHLGHRTVLQSAVDYAAANGLTPAAFTFLQPACDISGQNSAYNSTNHSLLSFNHSLFRFFCSAVA